MYLHSRGLSHPPSYNQVAQCVGLMQSRREHRKEVSNLHHPKFLYCLFSLIWVSLDKQALQNDGQTQILQALASL